MGIAKSALKLLIREAQKESFVGKSILQLGRQHTFLTLKQVKQTAKELGFALNLTDTIALSFKKNLEEHKCIDDVTLFSLLGFSTVHSLDASPYENATIVHDLNTPINTTPHQKYDVVFDGGTLEHVFHVPQVLKNIHQLLQTNGLIIHSSPSHNHVDHGFYMFSPTFFYDYYTCNSYKITNSYLFSYNSPQRSLWKVFDYKPGALETYSFGGFGKEMLGIWFVAKKTPIPQMV